MIKLILTPQSQPISYLFEKDTVVIGKIALEGLQPDLPLSLMGLSPAHVKIEEIEGNFYAFNLANDPLTTINKKPFRKKQIHNEDILEIKSLQLRFEGTIPPSEEIELEKKIEIFDNSLRTLLQNKIEKAEEIRIPSLSAPSSESDIDIDALLKRVSELEAAFLEADEVTIEHQPPVMASVSASERHAESTFIPKKEHSLSQGVNEQVLTNEFEQRDAQEDFNSSPEPFVSRQSLKDDYLRHLEDDNSDPAKRKRYLEHNSPRVVISWKTLLTLAASLMLFVCGAFAIFYVSVTDRSEKEEYKVAAAVADVAMALNFAQVNRALPQNQNWSDPDFLKHNTSAVLATGYFPLANIDTHGQFVDTSYILRIYTSSDLTHFLIIAQPNASLLQWLAPKATIIVDSERMELRKSNDLRVLNRMLVDPTLDSANSREIAQHVSQGELISLAELETSQKNTGFTTPKALAYIRPGAENYIYNAIRFYPFGESLTKKAIALYKAREHELDHSLLLQEIGTLQKLKNIVLYTSGGLQSALYAQKALASFAPQHKFLFGYLQFTPKGQVHGGHLLIDDNNSEVAALTPESTHAHPYLRVAEDTPIGSKRNDEEKYDSLLSGLFVARLNELQNIEMKIDHLIDTEIYTSIPHFPKRLQQLRHQYDHANEKHLKKVVRALAMLSLVSLEKENPERISENVEINLGQLHLFDFSSSNGLSPLLQSSLHSQGTSLPKEKFDEKKLTAQLDSIRQADSLSSLKKTANAVAALLTKKNIPNDEQLIAYQNAARAEVLQKLDYFLFSPEQSLSFNELKNENRPLISGILKDAWTNDEEEFDYYLNEFDLLCKPD